MHRILPTCWRGRRAAALVPFLLLVLLTASACSSAESWRWQWEHYTVDKAKLHQEREKLANAVREVLVHRRYYPQSDDGLETPGTDAVLVTDWNDEDARIMQGSFSGTRSRVAVRIVEGLDHHRPLYPRDEVHARRLDAQYWQDPDDETAVLALGIATARELNARMNYIPGEHTKAEWRPHGEDVRLSRLLFEQIRQQFNRVADREVPDPGEISERTRRIYEGSGSQRTDEENEPYRAIGPGSDTGGSGLRFGMDRASQ